MCGRYVFTDIKEGWLRFKAQKILQDMEPKYNAAPGQRLPVIVRRSPNQAVLMKWGLVPFWAKDQNIGYKMINARAEGIADKPSFRKPLKSQRCLVPANGFYEWRKDGKESTPYFIHFRDGRTFSFAGLYDIWRDVEGKEFETFTIITTSPNNLMSQIHDRMPVILKEEDEEKWLNKDESDPSKLSELLVPFPDKELEAYVVSREVNSPRNDNPDLIKPASTN